MPAKHRAEQHILVDVSVSYSKQHFYFVNHCHSQSPQEVWFNVVMEYRHSAKNKENGPTDTFCDKRYILPVVALNCPDKCATIQQSLRHRMRASKVSQYLASSKIRTLGSLEN